VCRYWSCRVGVHRGELDESSKKLTTTVGEKTMLQAQIASVSGELSKLKSEDQYQKIRNFKVISEY